MDWMNVLEGWLYLNRIKTQGNLLPLCLSFSSIKGNDVSAVMWDLEVIVDLVYSLPQYKL